MTRLFTGSMLYGATGDQLIATRKMVLNTFEFNQANGQK
jgi:hypothetical protein